MDIRLLHLHPGADLCFCSSVTKHRPAEPDVFRGIDEEDVVNRIVESALVEYCTFQGNNRPLTLGSCPFCEVQKDDRVDDGVDGAGVLDVGKEVICQKWLVELVAVEHLRTHQGDELLANLHVLGSESLGLLVAIIDRNAELLREKMGDVALSATDAACDAYRFQLRMVDSELCDVECLFCLFLRCLLDEVVNFLRRDPDVRDPLRDGFQVQTELAAFRVLQQLLVGRRYNKVFRADTVVSSGLHTEGHADLRREGAELFLCREVQSDDRHLDGLLGVVANTYSDVDSRRLVFHEFLLAKGNLVAARLMQPLEEKIVGKDGAHGVEDGFGSKYPDRIWLDTNALDVVLLRGLEGSGQLDRQFSRETAVEGKAQSVRPNCLYVGGDNKISPNQALHFGCRDIDFGIAFPFVVLSEVNLDALRSEEVRDALACQDKTSVVERDADRRG